MIKTEIADMTTDRDRALWERAIRILKGNVMPQTAQLFHGHTMICPSIGHLQGIWNWDSAFHAVGASYFDVSLAYDSVEGFLSLIREDGMLPDVMLLLADW